MTRVALVVDADVVPVLVEHLESRRRERQINGADVSSAERQCLADLHTLSDALATSENVSIAGQLRTEDRTLTVTQAARLLQIGDGGVKHHIYAGHLLAEKRGGQWAISEASVRHLARRS